MSDATGTETSSSLAVLAESDSVRPTSWNARFSRRSIVAPLSQVALVLFGVLLALAADRWNANRERAERADVALAAIRHELLENQSRIERAMLHHRAMRDTSSKLVSKGRVPDPQLYGAGLINPALLHSTAWESARDSGIVGVLSYDLVLKLSRLYANQERYRSLGQALSEAFYVEIMRLGYEGIARDRFANFLVLEVAILRGRPIRALVKLADGDCTDELVLPRDLLDPLDEGRGGPGPQEFRDGVGVE